MAVLKDIAVIGKPATIGIVEIEEAVLDKITRNPKTSTQKWHTNCKLTTLRYDKF